MLRKQPHVHLANSAVLYVYKVINSTRQVDKPLDSFVMSVKFATDIQVYWFYVTMRQEHLPFTSPMTTCNALL